MKKIVVQNQNGSAGLEVSGNSKYLKIGISHFRREAIKSEKVKLRIVATNPLSEARFIFLKSYKLFINTPIENIEINPTTNNKFQVVRKQELSPIKEILFIVEIKTHAYYGKKRFLRLKYSINSEKISSALTDIYNEESLEIDEFAKAIQNIEKSKGAIQQRIAKLKSE